MASRKSSLAPSATGGSEILYDEEGYAIEAEATQKKGRRLSLVEQQTAKAAASVASRRQSADTVEKGYSLMMRVRKAAKLMEKRARVRKSVVESQQPDLLSQADPSTQNEDYVYIDVQSFISPALMDQPELTPLEDLITKSLKKENEEFSQMFVMTYRIFTTPDSLIKSMYGYFLRALDSLSKTQVTKAVVNLLTKIVNDLSEEEFSQTSTALDTWEGLVRQQSEQLYSTLHSAIIRAQKAREALHWVDFDAAILKYKEEPTSLYELKGKDLADQLTLMDSLYYEKIDVQEIVIAVVDGTYNSKKCPALRAYWKHMDHSKEWISGVLDAVSNLGNKPLEIYLDKMITVMKTLKKLNNYGTFFMYIAALENASLRGVGKSQDRRNIVDRFWYLMSEYKDLLLNCHEPNSLYQKQLAKLKKQPFIPDLNLVLASFKKIIMCDGLMFYNSGVNFSKNINLYKEMKEYLELRQNYEPYRITRDKSVLKLLTGEPPTTGLQFEYSGRPTTTTES